MASPAFMNIGATAPALIQMLQQRFPGGLQRPEVQGAGPAWLRGLVEQAGQGPQMETPRQRAARQAAQQAARAARQAPAPAPAPAQVRMPVAPARPAAPVDLSGGYVGGNMATPQPVPTQGVMRQPVGGADLSGGYAGGNMAAPPAQSVGYRPAGGIGTMMTNIFRKKPADQPQLNLNAPQTNGLG